MWNNERSCRTNNGATPVSGIEQVGPAYVAARRFRDDVEGKDNGPQRGDGHYSAREKN